MEGSVDYEEKYNELAIAIIQYLQELETALKIMNDGGIPTYTEDVTRICYEECLKKVQKHIV